MPRTRPDQLFPPHVEPTPTQLIWASKFLFVWDIVNRAPASAGKTWFWRHVVAFIAENDGALWDQDPDRG